MKLRVGFNLVTGCMNTDTRNFCTVVSDWYKIGKHILVIKIIEIVKQNRIKKYFKDVISFPEAMYNIVVK